MKYHNSCISLAYPETYHKFLEKCVEQFSRVIIVFGNHEFYHGVKLNDVKGLVVLKHDMIYRDGDILRCGQIF